MSDLVTLQNRKLHAFLPGVATEQLALTTRLVSTLLADQDATLATGGGLTYALRSGKLTTEASIVAQFTLAAARTLIALGDQGDLATNEQILGIQLLSHTLASRHLTMVVRLVRGGSLGTLDIALEVV